MESVYAFDLAYGVRLELAVDLRVASSAPVAISGTVQLFEVAETWNDVANISFVMFRDKLSFTDAFREFRHQTV